MNHLRPGLLLKPLHQLLDFFPLPALFPGERGNGERPEFGHLHASAAFGNPIQ